MTDMEVNVDQQRVAEVEVRGYKLTYAVPSSMCEFRVRTLFTKEPETLKWIDTFEPDEVFADVGANVGMYTIYAAVTRGVDVVAFEPEAENFAVLNRNIMLNKLSNRVIAYPIALGDGDGLCVEDLYLAQYGAGGSCHRAGEEKNWKGEPTTAVFTQGTVMGSLGNFFSGDHGLDHVKIDVDGIESDIIKGLGELRPKSICIETNPALPEHRDMIKRISDMGYKFDPAQVARATRKEGPFKGVAEYVWHR